MQKLLYLVVHLLFWTTFTTLSWMAISSTPGEMAFIMDNPGAALLLMFWGVVNFYTFYLFVQPRFLDTRKFLTYFFISIAFSVLSSLAFVSIFWLIFESFRPYALQKFVEGIGGTFLISQSGSLLKGFVSWNESLHQKTELENKSLKNELAMLKAQLSPHFLFNTLNNIDTLIYKSQDEASAMLIRLSGLLRYMLYESDTSKVSIEQEMEYVHQLTDLQKLRFVDSDFIELTVNNHNPKLKIAPLLFLPFIENAFKFVSNPEQMPAISIKIDVGENIVHFTCRNYCNTEAMPKEGETAGGIGLFNARRRLELMYPDDFKLDVSQSENQFFVDLTLTVT
ncbi:MAG: sensor histidine kinase [Reichenbachiella sp.]